MKKVWQDWLHWSFKGGHLGFHRYGNCWKCEFIKTKYNTCTFYSFWRFYICFDKD